MHVPEPSPYTADGTGLHYARWGSSGPRILLLHAIGLDHQSWEPLIPYLADDYQILAPDLPGHGGSGRTLDSACGPRSLSASVEALLDRVEWPDAVVIGNSLGGGTALALAQRAPERVRGLGLLCSVAYVEGLPLLARAALLPGISRLAWMAHPLLVRVGLEMVRARWGSVHPEGAQRCSEYLRSPEGLAALLRLLRDLHGDELGEMASGYADIHCPALVLQGVRDPLIPVRHAERLAAALPQSELLCLKRCGHFPQEEDPGRTAAALLPFIERACR